MSAFAINRETVYTAPPEFTPGVTWHDAEVAFEDRGGAWHLLVRTDGQVTVYPLGPAYG